MKFTKCFCYRVNFFQAKELMIYLVEQIQITMLQYHVKSSSTYIWQN